jgi:DNA-binding CsgD family transcriptional regulator
MFAVDAEGTILSWTPGAEALLGRPARLALGRKCYDVIGGRLRSGKRLCGAACPIRDRARRTGGVADMELVVPERSGRRVVLRFSTVGLPDRGGIAHFFRPAASEWGRRAALALTTDAGLAHVSRREADVLRGLAHGDSTQDIATALCISPLTVRTHMRNLLRKLNLHSQVQLAVFAIRHGLS